MGAYSSVLAEPMLSNPNPKIYVGAGWVKIICRIINSSNTLLLVGDKAMGINL